MKFNEMSAGTLDEEQRKADQQILRLKAQKAPEEGPLLAALRVRRSQLMAEIARRSGVLALA